MSVDNILQKCYQTMWEIGMSGTRVGINEDGNVVCSALSCAELLQLKELYDDFKDIPEEYTIYDSEGNKLTR